MNNLLHQLQRIYPKTKSVADADKRLAIEVTSADVKASKRKDLNNCAIAVSCMRGDGNSPDFVIASRSRVYIIRKGKAVRYTMPENAVREITSFDRGATFTPGIYTIRPAVPTQRLGTESRRRKGGHGSEQSPIRHKLIDNIRATISEV